MPGTPGNFKFSLSRLGTDYSGPRHRHNFDQYRYMIEGESDYGQDGPLRAGMLGYYPEGVQYGPQVNKTEIFCAVLQFGGASGSGYLLPREVKAGMEELKAFGEFKDGIFYRHGALPARATWTPIRRSGSTCTAARWSIRRAATTRRSRWSSASYQWAAVKGVKGRVGKAVRRLDRTPHGGRSRQARGGGEL